MRYLLLGIVSIVVLPVVVFAAPQTFKELIDRVVTVMNILVPMLITVAIVLYFFGVAQNILNFGDEKSRKEKIRSFYGWGVLILLMMVSLWGILHLMLNTFYSADGSVGSFDSGESVELDCAYGECE